MIQMTNKKKSGKKCMIKYFVRDKLKVHEITIDNRSEL